MAIEQSRKAKKNKKIKIGIIVLLLVILSFVVGFGSYAYNIVKGYENTVYPGVFVENHNLAGCTKAKADELIRKNYTEPLKQKKITIKAQDKEYVIDYSKLNINHNIKEVVDKAFKYGKNENILKKYKMIKNPNSIKYKLSFTYDSKYVNDIVNNMEKEINKEAKNASISRINGGFNVQEEQNGQKLLKDKLIDEINNSIKKEEQKTIQAPIEVIKPKIKGEQLATVNSMISSFSTSFTTSSEERTTNIKLSTEAINGTVLMPGDEFSFNGVVGERSAEKGYKASGVIVGNKLESGLGGGVCQVSTTLYNTMLLSGLNATERTFHTLPSSYVDLGRDATVSYGSIDFKFKNTFQYPIYIEGYVNNKNVYFNFYSSGNLNNRKYGIRTNLYETVQPTVEYQNDSNLSKGQTEVLQNAYVGHKVKVFRDIYENGNLIKTETISDNFYRPVNGIIKRGTR